MPARSFPREEPTIRIWVRAVWRLPNGQHITRTVGRVVACEPNVEEIALVALHDFAEELEATGYDFREGHAHLVEVLGTAHG